MDYLKKLNVGRPGDSTKINYLLDEDLDTIYSDGVSKNIVGDKCV